VLSEASDEEDLISQDISEVGSCTEDDIIEESPLLENHNPLLDSEAAFSQACNPLSTDGVNTLSK
jgi:hypothetical protein